MRYVTYDPETGALTGSYMQDLLPEHEATYIVIDDGVAAIWCAYQANESRDGVELAPVIASAPIIPQTVTRRQALQALIWRGHDDDVDAALAAIPDPIQRKLARAEFDASQVFERQRPLVLSIGAALGLDLDDLFSFAAGL